MDKVVVLLPEGKLFDLVFAEAIAPSLKQAGHDAIRIAAEFSAESKLGAICNALEGADLVIADLTGANSNVFYLVGFAHGIGKKALLIVQHLENFPFDRTRHHVISYAGDRRFLKDELLAFFSGKTASPPPVASENANEKFLSLFGDILAAHGYEHRGRIELENPTTFILYEQDMDLVLVQDLARKARELGFRLKLM
jgi:hypothetical protein